MKTKGKILSLFLVLTLILGLIPMNGIGAFATGGTLSGSGTAEDPYLIYDAKDLAAFRDKVNSGSTDICGKLMADINLNEGFTFNDDGTYTGGEEPTQWTPIGSDSTRYVGTFDGNGKKVSGLYINGTSKHQGFFGYAYTGATIKNLGVENSYIKGTLDVGGVAGRNSGTVSNCYNTGTVSGISDVGGVVGWDNLGTVSNCYNTGTVSGTTYDVGGVVGWNSGTVENCYNTGTVSSRTVSGTGRYVGGVAGGSTGGTISNCYNSGAVRGKEVVGGVVGRSNYAKVKNCYYLNGTAQKGIGDAEDSDTTAKALSVAQMTGPAAKDNMTGFDFDTVWTVSDNNGGWKYAGEADDTTGKYQAGAEYPQLTVFEENGFASGEAEEIGLKQEVIDGKTFYLIYNAEQLKTFRNIVNDTLAYNEYFYTPDNSANGKLMADIDLNEGYTFNDDGTYTGGETPAQWTPIGNSNTKFAGTFDGNGHKVSGLYINTTSSYQGLFGAGIGATIKNLGVENSYIKGYDRVGGVVGHISDGTVENCCNKGTVRGTKFVGGIIGYCNGTAIACKNEGTISGSDLTGGIAGSAWHNGTFEDCQNTGKVSGANNVGGVAGYIDAAPVTNSYNTGTVTATGQNVGGVIGYVLTSVVTNCYNTGTVSGTGDSVGGVVGYKYSGTVTNCNNTGEVSGSGDNVGGVIGYSYQSPVSNCYNTGTVSGTGDSVGGVVGYKYSDTVTNCYNTGAVNGDAYVGGVAGYNPSGTVTNCYNTGAVSSIDGGTVGGVIGLNSGTIESCYNVGAVSSIDGGTVGGVAGYNSSGTVKNCYYLNGIAQKGIGNAEDSDTTAKALSVAQMTGTAAKDNMTGFDFDTVWVTGGDNGGWKYAGEADDITGKYQYSGEYPQLVVFEKNGFISDKAEAIGLQQEEIDGKTFYLIYNAEQLKTFRNIVNNTLTDDEYFYTPDNSANGKLMADIDLNEGYTFNDDGTYTGGETPTQWTPIGNNTTKFTGTFDGDGHKVSGLYINNNADNQGFFGYIYTGSVVKNLGIENSYIRGANYVGGVVGESYSGAVANCYNTGAVSGTSSYVGGVVGNIYNRGTVESCYNTGAVNGAGDVGGIVGRNSYYGTVTNCYNTGAVSGTSSYVGGVVGYNTSWSKVTSCYNTGAVSGETLVGGVVGFTYDGRVENCYNTGTVSGTGNTVGGLVGSSGSATVANCYNTGVVSGAGNYVGGVSGFSNGTVSNCYNTGTVSGAGDNVGGVVGENNKTVRNCYYLNGTAQRGIGNNEDSDTTAKALSVAEIENDLLAILKTDETGSWANECGKMGDWEYGKPAVQPIFTYQVKVDNVPAYTVTIPEYAEVGGSPVQISAEAGELRANQQLYVKIDDSTELTLTLDGEDDKIAFVPYLVTEEKDLSVGDTVLETNNTKPNETATTDIGFKLKDDEIKYAGTYTGTVTFTVSLEAA